jgi:hypothetical protein
VKDVNSIFAVFLSFCAILTLAGTAFAVLRSTTTKADLTNLRGSLADRDRDNIVLKDRVTVAEARTQVLEVEIAVITRYQTGEAGPLLAIKADTTEALVELRDLRELMDSQLRQLLEADHV